MIFYLTICKKKERERGRERKTGRKEEERLGREEGGRKESGISVTDRVERDPPKPTAFSQNTPQREAHNKTLLYQKIALQI